MRGIEIFTLDACVLSVINSTVFRAQLANGHEFVVYGAKAAGVRIGDCVSVALSPYDMAQGRMVLENEVENESAQLSQANL